MYENEKIYSIEIGEVLEMPDPPKESPAIAPASQVSPRPSRPALRPKSAPRPQPQVESKPPSGGLHFAPLMILTFLLGPFSVHLNPENRERKGLLTVGMISGMACLGLFAGRGFILDIIGESGSLWPLAAIATLVGVTVFSVWTRALYLAGKREGMPRHKLPSLLRKPWAVGIVGLIAPGLGLLMAGCARRGAAVIWAGLPVAAAVIVLVNGMGIWSRNQVVQAAPIQPEILETIFMISAGILIAGLIGWIAQALEGARQMMGEPGIRHRMRGDWYAAALMCTLVGMAVVWDPPTAARYMDNSGIVLREKGFQVIPLHLTRGAHHLDPGPSEYGVQLLELYEDLGRRDEAVRLRKELDGNLASYLALVQTESGGLAMRSKVGRTSTQDWKVMEEMFGQAGPHGGDRPAYQAR
jgi:hypothetical protein